jgi:DNA (cytosine-5)-methyltransferase 1
MKLGSLFDGAGGFPLASAYAGFTTVWVSEIEPFPIRVTSKRFPNAKHLGDISKINGALIEPVDVITFGSPCQDLSIAGARAGIDGKRSGLFFEAIRIIKEMREATNGKYPTFIVWENVPGAFSSGKGEDFRQVIEEIVQIAEAGVSITKPKKWCNAGEIVGDGYSIAWRVYDAQFWGVPQRRRRIFLVADFGGGRAGRIQFERDSLLRDFAPGGETGQGAAGAVKNRAGTASGVDCLNPWDSQSSRVFGENGVSPTLDGADGGGGRNPGGLLLTGDKEVTPINLQVATRHMTYCAMTAPSYLKA